jgi:4-amino-4-deoxy-L-arabinose transferase-like glycosyltransferase
MEQMTTSEEPGLGKLPLGRPAISSRNGRWRFWISPPGQPWWARPALLGIACIAGLAYAWGANNADLEPYYGAAARSMSSSWHDFLFGALDPAGTVTVDKLPGALWLEALSLRILGFHVWAVVLPQIIEGVITVLVLYRAVRRLAGPVGAMTAALVLATSPVTVALNRGNVADSLLILLTVLAADATAAAVLSGRTRTIVLAGVWVGLAFQAKMLQAWLVLPALALAYLVAAPPSLRIRIGQLALAGAVAVAVSLSWMMVVSLVPAGERPYVDGTQNDSVFTQVFVYNGIARLEHGKISAGPTAGFLLQVAREGNGINSQSVSIPPSWHRLLGGLFGRDDGWLLPAALIAAGGVLFDRRRARRRDPARASVLMWGAWLVVLAATFSEGVYLNSYYVAALSPAIAALCGTGVGVLWRQRHRPAARGALAGSVLACSGYGVYLLQGASAVPVWLAPIALSLGVGGALVAMLATRPRGKSDLPPMAISLALACALALATVTSVLVVTREIGPFSNPYVPEAQAQAHFSVERTTLSVRRVVGRFMSSYGTPIAFAVDTSSLAAPYIYYTGAEVLPIGGFAGGGPAPSLRRLRRYIASDQLRAFSVPLEPPTNDPRLVWVRTHCAQVRQLAQGDHIRFGIYDCAAAS